MCLWAKATVPMLIKRIESPALISSIYKNVTLCSLCNAC